MSDSSPIADACPAAVLPPAVLVAVGASELETLVGEGAHALLPLGPRSIIETQMRRLVAAGVPHVHVVLHEAPREVQDHLQGLARWGVPVTFHLVRSRERAAEAIARLDGEGPLLVVDARCLAPLPTGPELRGDVEGRFTGTGWADRRTLASLQPGQRLPEAARSDVLWLDSPTALLNAMARLLGGECLGGERLGGERLGGDRPGDELPEGLRDLALFEEGRERAAVGRNVRIHPLADVRPPVVLGDDCDIARGAVVGPNVVLGRGCVLDDGAELRDAIVADRTYIGTGLDVEQSLVSGDRLAHARLGTTLTIADRSLIDPILPPRRRQWGRSSLLYTLAVLLWLATRPLAWLTWPWRGRLDRAGHVRRHFVSQFLPGLWQVVVGRRRLVGTSGQPNTVWHSPHAGPGLVTEALVQQMHAPGGLETLVADSYYAATATAGGDLRLLAGYVRRLVAA